MDPLLAAWLAALRQHAPAARVGGAEARTSLTAERFTMDVLSPDGMVATATVYLRPKPVAVAPAQLALPIGGPAAASAQPAPAPSTDLTELVAADDGWEPTPADERFDATTVIVWTSNEVDHWRTVVPADLAPWVRARLAGHLAVEAPGHLRSHVVRLGDSVETRLGPLEVLAFMSDEIGATTGMVLAANRCDRVVSWLDSAINSGAGAALVFGISPATIIEQGADGGWCVAGTRGQAPEKAPEKPAIKPTLYRARPTPDADHRAMGLASLVIHQSGEWSMATWWPAGEKPATWKARLKTYTDALGMGDIARRYDAKGACVWDSRDGAGKAVAAGKAVKGDGRKVF